MTEPIIQPIKVDYDGKGVKDAARDMKRVEEATKKAGDSTKRSGEADKQAAREAERRGSSSRGLQRRLDELTLAEVKHEQKVRAGVQVDEQAIRASNRRRTAMGRINQRLTTLKATQDRVTQSVSKTSGAVGEMNPLLGAATRNIAGMAASMVGAGGVIALYREWIGEIETANQRLKENSRIVQQNAEARLNLVALRGVEDPEEVKRLDAAAAFAGRSPGEVSRVAAIFQSQFPRATPEQLAALTQETAAAGQLTDASLTTLAAPIAAIFKETGDARVAGNIFQEAIQQAGQPDPGKLGEVIRKFIGVGKEIGGLTTAQSVGFAAAGTGLGLPDEIATTGLKNVLFAIAGKGTPEGTKILERERIDRSNIELAIQQISQAKTSGRITSAELEVIGGREAAPVFAALSDPAKLADFLAGIQKVKAAGKRAGRIVTEKAEGVFAPESIQAFNLLAKQQKSRDESTRAADPKAARQQAAREILNRLVTEKIADGSISPALGERIKKEFDAQLALGNSVEQAIFAAEQTPNTDFTVRLPLLDNLASVSLFGNGAGPSPNLRGRSNFLEDPLLETLEAGPDIDPSSLGGGGATTVIQQQTNMEGTIIIHAGDPETDDIADPNR